RNVLCNRLSGAADPRPDRSTSDSAGTHAYGRAHQIGGDCKSNPVRSSAPRKNRRRHADEMALHVDEGTARVAGIDGSVSLNKDALLIDTDTAARGCRYDAARDRLTDAERVADGQHEIAHLERVGIAERQHGKALPAAVDP